VATGIDKEFKGRITVDGNDYTVAIDPECVRLIGKGKRKPEVNLPWNDLLSGGAASGRAAVHARRADAGAPGALRRAGLRSTSACATGGTARTAGTAPCERDTGEACLYLVFGLHAVLAWIADGRQPVHRTLSLFTGLPRVRSLSTELALGRRGARSR
jgi:hypothetical protein